TSSSRPRTGRYNRARESQPMTKRVQLTAIVSFVAAAAVGLAAGHNPPAPAQPQQPTFKLRVDYVEVDVVVTDRAGNLVKDLKKEDFQVLEDGKAQSISAFTQVDIPIDRADRPLYSNVALEPDVATNEAPFDGRVYVMVIDDLHTNFARGARGKSAAKQFIERRRATTDPTAV